ncbi:MAG: hypothetical protein DWQ31_18420 [Planctomycetota bacterium]|nr:MAG: hypothetical protein DWQ31_18420 [Planctomycetota bacterium]REJ95175.1 MAG: hypothetical protein DWQ35_06930 [Planctomycetota bacterium]
MGELFRFGAPLFFMCLVLACIVAIPLGALGDYLLARGHEQEEDDEPEEPTEGDDPGDVKLAAADKEGEEADADEDFEELDDEEFD